MNKKNYKGLGLVSGMIVIFFLLAAALPIFPGAGSQRAQADDFRLQVTPPARTIDAGDSTHYQVTVQFTGNYNSPVNLTVSGLPEGASGSFTVNPITQTGNGRTKLEIDTLPTTPAGTYTLTISGRGGGIEHSYDVILIINGQTPPQLNCEIQKSFSPAAALPGDEITMTIRLRNNSGAEFGDITIQDELSPHLEYLGDNAPVRLRRSGQKLVWRFAVLKGKPVISFDVKLRVAGDVPVGVIGNTAYIYHDSLEAPITSNPALLTIDAIKTMAVELTKTVDKTTAKPGDSLRYRITLRNNSSLPLTGIELNDFLSTHLEFISARQSGGAKLSFSRRSRELTWKGELAAHKQQVITLEARIKSDTLNGTRISNSAFLKAAQLEETAASNTVSTLVSAAPISISGVRFDKSCAVPQSRVGSIIRFRLTAVNSSSSLLIAPVIEDHLPQGFSYVPRSSLMNNRAFAEPRGKRRLEWRLADIKPGETIVLRYRVVVGAAAKRGKNVNRAILRLMDNSGQDLRLEASAFVNLSAGSFIFYSSINGTVYLDRDGDSFYSMTDTPLPGIEVRLSTGEKTLTDALGQYAFENLFPGACALGINRVTLAEKYRLASPSPRAVVLSDGLSDTVDFALKFAGEDDVGTARFEGRVFLDKNRDRAYDSGDALLMEFRAKLDSKLLTRGRAGSFVFTNLEPGKHTVEILYSGKTLKKEITVFRGQNRADFPLKFRGIKVIIKDKK
ncbi:MAG: DUF11 domain-containing protein [Candidatus Aminicenantes bacterium]|nr:DUF11 domain-containing protein [Candidatus Aminicenantes bacterium]